MFTFQHVFDANEAIFRYRTKHKANNYLEDFLFVTMCEILCNQLVKDFIDICSEISFPLSEEKTQWAAQIIVFLGMGIDSIYQVILVPIEK